MEIREYLRILRRRAWIPLLLVVVTGVSTALFTLAVKPSYTATATVLAKSIQSGTQGLNFQEVAASNTLLLRVRKELGLTETVDELSSHLTISAGRSNIYKVAFNDGDANRAVTIANAVATDAAELYQKLGGGAGTSVITNLVADQGAFRDQYLAATTAWLDFNAKYPPAQVAKDRSLQAQQAVLDLDKRATESAYLNFVAAQTQARVQEVTQGRSFEAAVVDQAAAKPDTMTRLLKVLYAIALALVVGIGLVFAVEYFDNSVRDPDEVEKLIGAPVVGIIPRATVRTLRMARGSA